MKGVGVASGGTVDGGATVSVGSPSNVAVGVGWIVDVGTVSRMSGTYSLYGPIGGTVGGEDSDGSVGIDITALSSRKAR